jgi:hypothetical protein
VIVAGVADNPSRLERLRPISQVDISCKIAL